MNSLGLFLLPKATPGCNTLGCNKYLHLLKILVISDSFRVFNNAIVNRLSHSDKGHQEFCENMEFMHIIF